MFKILLCLLFIPFSFALDLCPEEPIPGKVLWKSKMRVEVLRNLDQFLNWKLEDAVRSFAVTEASYASLSSKGAPFMERFVLLHGFFSLYSPLVGRVTGSAEDLKSTQCVLKGIASVKGSGAWQRFAADELLAKVLAYRDLRLNEVWFLPVAGELELMPYRIDAVFNLWMGMPAFGLAPLEKGAPLLLFRGTDFSLDSPRGWASLMSDVDMAGPGLYTFQRAQPKIHLWLQKMADEGRKARVLGYSLGGAFAAYAYIFERALISDEGSVAFDMPGVSGAVIEKWDALGPEQKRGFTGYINQGDMISKVGKLFGLVYALSIDMPMKPLTAHTLLMSGQPQVTIRQIDVEVENRSRAQSR